MVTEIFNGTNGTFSSSRDCIRNVTVTRVVFPVLYTIVFFLGVIIHSISIWIFLHVSSNSVFIVFLKNTIAADLIMTLTLPFKILTDSGIAPWHLRVYVCRFSAVIFYQTLYVNMILLGLIGFDRFIKIVKPHRRYWTDNVFFAKSLSAAVWIVMLGIFLPNMILTNQNATPQNVKKCASLKSQLGIKWHEVVNYFCQIVFVTVLILLILFYTIITKKVYASFTRSKSKDSNARKKLKAKVFIVIVVFCVCFAPYHFVRIPYTISQIGKIKDCHLQNRLFIAKESTLWLAATNVIMDPLIYVLLCKPFRKLLFGYITSISSSLESPFLNESTL
ncbi:P2Y purinoceptor 13 [Bombina bombina]|uniref:P2Y purinoceptor 13 n=1 Tax=Bombina bombina TaxID=8345 RepID=UPI00235A6128|nr:P2Y purinoceptor 13 [Bombina bombina]